MAKKFSKPQARLLVGPIPLAPCQSPSWAPTRRKSNFGQNKTDISSLNLLITIHSIIILTKSPNCPWTFYQIPNIPIMRGWVPTSIEKGHRPQLEFMLLTSALSVIRMVGKVELNVLLGVKWSNSVTENGYFLIVFLLSLINNVALHLWESLPFLKFELEDKSALHLCVVLRDSPYSSPVALELLNWQSWPPLT